MYNKLFLWAAALAISTSLNSYAQDYRLHNWDSITIPILRPKSNHVLQNDLKKENIDKKRKPELYTDFKRGMGWFVGVNKIDHETAAHRQINYRLSEMNTAAKHWTKIEIVDADMNLKKGEGFRLLAPYLDAFKEWAKDSKKLKDICSIDLEYDPKGEMVIRETAKDEAGNVIYIGGYKYSIDPSMNQTVVSIIYTQSDDAALFEYKKEKATTIRYTYKNDSIDKIELINIDGKSLDIDFLVLPLKESDSIVKRDKYHRVESILYYEQGKKYESLDRVHKKEYRYDVKGNVTYEKWTSCAGEIRYLYEKTSTYVKTQNLDGIISVDSLDSHGNITWSARIKNSMLIPMYDDGTNIRYTTYDYYDKKKSESFRSKTRYCTRQERNLQYIQDMIVAKDSIGHTVKSPVLATTKLLGEKNNYIVEEEFDYTDSIYTTKVYNGDGVFVGGISVNELSFPRAGYWSPELYNLVFFLLPTYSPSHRIGIDDEPSYPIAPYNLANAMVVSITGGRAKRLGLRDNDIIAGWNEWAYLNRKDSLPDLNRLWLNTIYTQFESKYITVLRQEVDSLYFVRIWLPKGNLDELQFTLMPAKVSYSTQLMLSTFKSNSYMYHTKSVMMGVPKNSYTHKPIIIYAAGHHSTLSYEKKRPNPLHEWGYKKSYRGYTNNFSSLPEGEKVTAYFTKDLNTVECDTNILQNYEMVTVSLTDDREQHKIFKRYEEWYNSYLSLEREIIELPLLKPNNYGYLPDEVMYQATYHGNENGYNLWYKRKPSDNAPIKKSYGKHDYYDFYWKQWEKKYLKGAKKSYIIPLDYSNEQQTLTFLEYLSEITLQKYSWYAPWVIAETHYDNDYYVLILSKGNDEKSINDAKKGVIGKGSKIFIYDRYNRKAAYIER